MPETSNQPPSSLANSANAHSTDRLIDSHCHLDNSAFNDVDELLHSCQQAGISDLIVPGLHEAQWAQLRHLKQRHSQLHIAFGRHPWWLKQGDNLQQFSAQLAMAAADSTCIAIGETGIDGLKGIDLKLQIDWFEQHLKIASQLQKPLIVHAVRAHPQVQQLLAKYRGKVRGVIHDFSGSAELAQSYWQLGFYLGIGGTISYPRASKTQRAVAALPLESLLLETDAPDMPLHGQQGQANHPLKLLDIAQQVAQLRGESLAHVAEVTSHNCLQLFGI